MIAIRPDVVVQPALAAWEVFFLAAAGAGAVLLLQAGIAAVPEVAGDLVRWYRHFRRRAKLGGAISPLELTAEDPSTFRDDPPLVPPLAVPVLRHGDTLTIVHPPSVLDEDIPQSITDAAASLQGFFEEYHAPHPASGEPTEAHDVLADAAWQTNGRIPVVPEEARKRWVATTAGLHFDDCRYAGSGKQIDAVSPQEAAAYAMEHRPPLRICTNCHPTRQPTPQDVTA